MLRYRFADERIKFVQRVKKVQIGRLQDNETTRLQVAVALGSAIASQTTRQQVAAAPLVVSLTNCLVVLAQQSEANFPQFHNSGYRQSVVCSPCNAQPNYWVYPSKPPWFWMKTVGVLVQKYGTFWCKVWWFLGREYCGLGKPIICFLFRNR